MKKDTITRLTKINKHLSIALGVLSEGSLYIGDLREQRRLVRVKLKLEHIIDKTSKFEKLEKERFLRKLKG